MSYEAVLIDEAQSREWPLPAGRTVLGRRFPPPSSADSSPNLHISRSHAELNFSSHVGIVTIITLGLNPTYIHADNDVIALSSSDDPYFVRESDSVVRYIALVQGGPKYTLRIRAVVTPNTPSKSPFSQEAEATLLVDFDPNLMRAQASDVEMRDEMAQTMVATPSNTPPTPMDLDSQPLPLSRAVSVTPEIAADQLRLIATIGSGACGQVFKARWLGTLVAVKKIFQSLLHGNALREFQAETSMLKRLRHPNVVLLIGVTKAPISADMPLQNSDLCIITEFLSRGSLRDVLASTCSGLLLPISQLRPALPKPVLEPLTSIKMALDAATGVAYLHASHVMHRDLKSANCLVAADGTVKIGDLGLATLVNPAEDQRTFCGTLTHCAPEILNSAGYSYAADVYSFGVILWEIITHEEPYTGMSKPAIILGVCQQHQRPAIPGQCTMLLDKVAHFSHSRSFDVIQSPPPPNILTSSELALLGLWQLACSCWHPNPHSRPQFVNIVDALSCLGAHVERRLELERHTPQAPQPAATASDPIASTAETQPNRSLEPFKRPLDKEVKNMQVARAGPASPARALSQILTPSQTVEAPKKVIAGIGNVSKPSLLSGEWELDANELIQKDKVFEDDISIAWTAEYRNQEVLMKQFKERLGGEELEEFERELKILGSIRSPRVTYFYGAVLKRNPIIVTEHVPTTLLDVLSATGASHIKIDWDCVFSLAGGIATACLHLHSWKPQVLVRNLCPSNIACDVGLNYFVKIGNFHFARILSNSEETKIRTPASIYSAPESFLTNTFSVASDIYSFGVILLEIVVRCLGGKYERAFSEFSDLSLDFHRVMAASKRNLRPTIPTSCPKPLAALIGRCWAADPSMRPTSFVEILSVISDIKELWERQRKRKMNPAESPAK